jgi:hypothetical protein
MGIAQEYATERERETNPSLLSPPREQGTRLCLKTLMGCVRSSRVEGQAGRRDDFAIVKEAQRRHRPGSIEPEGTAEVRPSAASLVVADVHIASSSLLADGRTSAVAAHQSFQTEPSKNVGDLACAVVFVAIVT